MTKQAYYEPIVNDSGYILMRPNVSKEADIIQARDVGPAIVEEAVEREADLIIIGLTQKRRVGSCSVGNVIPHVLKEAPCRVLLSREPISEVRTA